MRILIAEDNRLNRVMLCAFFESHGHTLIEAADGISALRLALTQRPDFAVIDWNMPGMMGDDVIAAMHDDPRTAGIPCVLISGALDDVPGVSARLAHTNLLGCLPKPFNLRDLISLIEAYTESR